MNIPAKELSKAIDKGMTYEEAAEHALGQLGPMKFLKPVGAEEPESDWLVQTIKVLHQRKDHSLRFDTDEDSEGGVTNWTVTMRPYQDDAPIIFYDGILRQWPDDDAEEDAAALNRFVLDFYGIKRHKEITPSREEARDRIRQIRIEIRDKKRDIRALAAEMSKLSELS